MNALRLPGTEATPSPGPSHWLVALDPDACTPFCPFPLGACHCSMQHIELFRPASNALFNKHFNVTCAMLWHLRWSPWIVHPVSLNTLQFASWILSRWLNFSIVITSPTTTLTIYTLTPHIYFAAYSWKQLNLLIKIHTLLSHSVNKLASVSVPSSQWSGDHNFNSSITLVI